MNGKIQKLLASAESALNDEFPPNIEVAFSAYQKALELDQDCVAALDAFGSLLADLGDNDRATQILMRAVQLSPNEGAEKYFYLGQMMQGADALSAYRKCDEILSMELREGDEEGKARLVSVYCAIGELFMTDLSDTETAETDCKAALDAALRVDGSSVEALNGMATFFRVRLEIKESIQYALKAFEEIAVLLDSNEFERVDDIAPFALRERLAENLVELGLPEEALTVLSTMLEEDEEDIQAWFLTSCCHLVTKQKEDAAECLKQCHRLLRKNRASIEPRMIDHWTKTLEDLASRISNVEAQDAAEAMQ